MKITSFNPLIVSKQAEEIVALFEELGFKKRHAPTMDDQTAADQDFRLKDANGFYVDVAQHPGVPQDVSMIRMNVRDFDEAYDYFISKGFKNAQGDKIIHTDSSKAAYLVSPTGFGIGLTYHIRKEDKDQ